MTAKEYLELAYRIDCIIRQRQDICAGHRASLYGRSIDLSGAHCSSGGDSLGKAIGKVADYEAETDRIISDLVSIRLDIEKSIMQITNKMQRETLINRYLLYCPWKNVYDKDTGELIRQGIREKMGYSSEAVFKFHSEGLKKITVPENITVKYSEILSRLC